MKTLTIIISLLISSICFSQKKEVKPKPEATKQEHLLDMQAKMYTDILGESLTNGKDPKNINGFIDLIKKSDLSPEQKEEAIKQYKQMGGTLEADRKLKEQYNLKVKDSITINKKS